MLWVPFTMCVFANVQLSIHFSLLRVFNFFFPHQIVCREMLNDCQVYLSSPESGSQCVKRIPSITGWIFATAEMMCVYTNVVLFEMCECEQEVMVELHSESWTDWKLQLGLGRNKKKTKKKHVFTSRESSSHAAKISIWFRFGEFACFGCGAKHVVMGREQSWWWVDWFGNGT